jgi:tungstate transport system substrate-binding protein
MKRFAFFTILVALLLAACAPVATPTEATVVQPTPIPSTPTAPAIVDLILATTSSTQDSGLLDVLIPLFEQQTGFKVQVVAVGSGAAMTMGQEGNADVLLVHSPSSEKTFMDGGFGSERLLVMHNDFIIVGPAADPAGIKAATSAVDAFTKIANAKAPFLTRGDKSGTNIKELAIWISANITPAGDWYINTGQGMGASLTIADEKDAYILTDRATWLANQATYTALTLLYQGDNSLLNVYHVITVNPDKWPKVNADGAKAFATWITSAEIQLVIGDFGKEQYGQGLFIPDAAKTDADLGLK